MAPAAKPADPAPADPPADDPMDADAEAEEHEEEAESESEAQPLKKRGRRKRLPREPSTPATGRPSRERKTVERYSELTPRSTPAKKSAAILQGSGTKLKEIPNVFFKLSKRKVDDNLQSLHTILFGRRSNAHFLKRNLAQFSGFVWTDNPEKQRNRIKEKLDKMNKEKLIDFCDILDVQAKQLKKEEVSAKLLEFLESPCITRDVVISDVKKGKKRRRKSKGTSQATAEGASGEKKKRKSRKQAVEAENENDEDDAGPAGDSSMGESDEDSEVKEETKNDEEPEVTPVKKKSTDDKQGKKEAGSKAKEKDASAKKTPKSVKRVSKPDVELESKKAAKKTPKNSTKESSTPVGKAKKKVAKPKKDVGKESQNNSKARKKRGAKASGENKGKGKVAPTTKQLHGVVSNILKEVDFNTVCRCKLLCCVHVAFLVFYDADLATLLPSCRQLWLTFSGN
uniref:Protein DEK n=1 Tax=Triticum urartu TaxID=4572 RepID=A0A8R7U0Z6_TRIUA